MKTCAKCKETKDYKSFCKAKNRPDGYYNYCRECKSKDDKRHYCPIKTKEYKLQNKEKNKANWVKWRSMNREELNKRKLEYYHLNKKEINKKAFIRTKARLKVDNLFRFKTRVRGLVRDSFRRSFNNRFRKSKQTEDILCCTVGFFTEYISSKFSEGMSFENYGKWHLDHIIPLSTANNEEDVIRLNHYTNIQPLWAKDNLRKSNKIERL
jgi:hypothetical protein